MSEPIDQQKSTIRQSIAARLRAMTPQERHDKSIKVCQRVIGLEPFSHAGVVMLYMPLPTEVDVTPIAIRCFQSGRTVCVPRVDWQRRDMTPVEVTRFDDSIMDVDEHGIRVPRDGRPILPALIDLVVIPGLAFDTRGRRLGRGGGFYDRFLRRVSREAIRVAVCFDDQIVEEVPVTPCDMTVDIVATDRRCTHVANAHAR